MATGTTEREPQDTQQPEAATQHSDAHEAQAGTSGRGQEREQPANAAGSPNQPTSGTPTPSNNGRTAESTGFLLRRLVDEAATLFSKEMALARSEFTQALNGAKAGAASLATGGAVLFAGFLFLLGAAVLGLRLVVAPWLAALIVGGIVVVVGAILLASGKKKMTVEQAKMQRTTESLQHDKDLAQGRLQ